MSEAAAELYSLFSMWRSSVAARYGRMATALIQEAITDPRYNYDKFITGGWEDETENGKRTATSTSTPGVIRTDQHYVAGDDSATPVLASQTVSTPTPSTQDKIVTVNDLVTDTDTRTYSDYHEYGNIGIQTAADMVDKILKLYHNRNLTQEAIEEFIDRFTVYC